MEKLDGRVSLLEEEMNEQAVSFRALVKGIPSTTYATFGLYRYPAKFIPQVIAYVLEEYARSGMSIFDPFAGYGTTGVVSRVYGHDYELWDLNPIIEVLHAAATMELPDVHVEKLISDIKACRSEFVPEWSNLSYWFPEEFLPLLFRAWGFYHSLNDLHLKLLLTIPLLRATRHFSYDDMQRQKLSKSPKSRARVASLLASSWEDKFYAKLAENVQNVKRGVKEYLELSPKNVKATVRGGVDTLSMNLSEERDILITSPPYLQAQEYIRQAKMDLFWLGYPETFIKDLSKQEIPYRAVAPFDIQSEAYAQWTRTIQEHHLQVTFDRYFWGILGALTRLQEKISSYLFLFVGSATVRGCPVPIDRIFAEHFTALGWNHEATLKDTIVARQMFFYNNNPATGLKDQRMRTESLVVLRR
ncbi:hypothetical protein ACFLSK_00690 [Chloroflexota bacterium]